MQCDQRQQDIEIDLVPRAQLASKLATDHMHQRATEGHIILVEQARDPLREQQKQHQHDRPAAGRVMPLGVGGLALASNGSRLVARVKSC